VTSGGLQVNRASFNRPGTASNREDGSTTKPVGGHQNPSTLFAEGGERGDKERKQPMLRDGIQFCPLRTVSLKNQMIHQDAVNRRPMTKIR
jgi:hypothetical protein